MLDKNFIKWKSYKIFKGSLGEISFDGKLFINTLNQYSYCLAEEDAEFKSALTSSDILLPDGISIVAAVRMQLNKKVRKIAGADLHLYLLDSCSTKNKSCFYLGSSDSTLEKIKNRLHIEYPDLRVGFYSPPYCDVFTDDDSQKMIDAVNKFKPDVLFVGMTAPKQEKWLNFYKAKLDVHVACTIGAAFDFYAGTIERASKIWIDLGLEWLIRLLKEPKRMWKRYMYYGPVFMATVLKTLFKSDAQHSLVNTEEKKLV